MTIRRGDCWGEPLSGGVEAKKVSDDHQLAVEAQAAHRGGDIGIFSLSHGDVAHSLGFTPATERQHPMAYGFDLGRVSLDSGLVAPFVAHCVARGFGWTGQGAVAMNTGWYGRWYLGPKAHPNDGLLDITWGTLPFRQALLAWRRAKTGTHLPHPELKTRRTSRWQYEFERPKGVWVDGVRVGKSRTILVEVIGDAFTVVG